MKINNNISAVITNKHLLRTENRLAGSMERLSSGFKLNHSWDNPSGIAISNKMNAQIDGLNRASRNASDGISVLDTADGALGELTNMLQRMRELAVQAANDTNTLSDKQAIQNEIDSLTKEIDRVASSTEFNTKSLLNGSLDNRVYADHVTRTQVSSNVEEGFYNLTIIKAAEQAYDPTQINLSSIPSDGLSSSGTVFVNGYGVNLEKGMSKEEVYEALRQGAEVGECILGKGSGSDPKVFEKADVNEPFNFVSEAFGVEAKVEVYADNAQLANELGISTKDNAQTYQGQNPYVKPNTTDGEFKNHSQASIEYRGNKMIITDVNGFEMSMMIDEGTKNESVSLEVSDIGPMDLQIGSNEGQQMAVRIPAVDTRNLYIDNIDVTTVTGADRAIASYDDAIDKVNSIRSRIGAYTNRLEHTIESLDATEENVTSAISRLKDVDMAEEMTEFTKYNVLQQAGTSALSQANELPQMALQLMG